MFLRTNCWTNCWTNEQLNELDCVYSRGRYYVQRTVGERIIARAHHNLVTIHTVILLQRFLSPLTYSSRQAHIVSDLTLFESRAAVGLWDVDDCASFLFLFFVFFENAIVCLLFNGASSLSEALERNELISSHWINAGAGLVRFILSDRTNREGQTTKVEGVS